MRLLLDTCTFLWLTGQPAKLSAPAIAAINNPQNELFLSDTSVWEIVLKHTADKLPLPESPRIWLPKQTAFFQLQPVRISSEAIFKTADLPLVHRDPFDRLLAAQALVDGFKFISPDPPFRAFGVDCLW
jgi:PIN domain nuclease of toxin-antitoxin system